MLKIQDIVLI